MTLTANGRSLLVAAGALLPSGVISGYGALAGIGFGLAMALLVAFVLVSRPTAITATRRVVPDRVAVGSESESVLTVTNRTLRRSGAGTVRERFGDREVTVELPALDSGATAVVRRTLPTERRGVFQVGPLSIRRGDPLGLLLRGSNEHDTAKLIVHPTVHLVNPFPAGVTRDLDGTPSGEASEGGITFSAIREYVPGDDLRLIHWRSAAKTGKLMVRYNVDHQQPRTAVILDTRAHMYEGDAFEDAVRAAASVASSAISRRYPFIIRTTSGHMVDERSSRMAVMDMFSEVQMSEDPSDDLGQAGRLAARDPAGLSLACITGNAGLEDLRGLGPLRARYDELTIVRMGISGSGVFELGGAVLINSPTSEEFARAWNRRIRR